MKSRFTIVGILLGILVLSASASALTWETYLDEISVSSGTVDIDDVPYKLTNTSITETTNYSKNITLPCAMSELDGAGTYINISAINDTVNITYNLTVNGVKLNTSSNLNATNTSQWFKWNLTAIKNKVQKNASEYLNFTYNFNETEKSNVTIVINASDAALSSTWLDKYVSVAEALLQSPEVHDEQAHSYFAVKDRVATNNSLGYTITDISLNLTYPTHNLSRPTLFVNITTLSTSTMNYTNVSYQKYGPYVYGKPKEEIDDDDHEVTIRVSSHEVLSRLVTWDFDETAEDYEDYFVTINYDTLEVRLNNVKIDWEEASIEMEEMTLVNGTNKYEFSWTEAAPAPAPAAPGIWDWLYEDYGTGIVLWLWFIIIVVVGCVIATVAYALKKK